MKAPLIQNETDYDGRTVNSIVRWVFKDMELDGDRVMVKVKHHRGTWAYQGRFYPHARWQSKEVYSWDRGEYVEVGPRVPAGISHLLVCRIGRPGIYPCQTHVYKRKDSPGTWEVADWREALVSITAHEAMHLRQYRTHPKGKRGRFNEVQTEWAAFRLWRDWKSKKN